MKQWTILGAAMMMWAAACMGGQAAPAPSAKTYEMLGSFGGQGSTEGKFLSVRGIALGKDGSVYVADMDAKSVSRFTADGKYVGKCKTECIPGAVVVDDKGFIYVGGCGKTGVIEKLTPDGKLVKKWNYGKGEAVAGGMAISGEFLYIGNNRTGQVEKFTLEGQPVKAWGKFASCCGFLDVAVDSKGTVYVGELGRKKVKMFDGDGKELGSWGTDGTGAGQFCGCCNPVNLAIGPDGTVITGEKTTPRVQEFTTDGKPIAIFGEKKFGEGCGCMDLAVSADGKVYVLDDEKCKVLVFACKETKNGATGTGKKK
jgi:DNA-binding beta-propeller fold protein YncE